MPLAHADGLKVLWSCYQECEYYSVSFSLQSTKDSLCIILDLVFSGFARVCNVADAGGYIEPRRWI